MENRQLAKVEDAASREQAEKVFGKNYEDYGRKLYLIENCIYGVDIQPIAVQISKLRFFVSLVVDQRANAKADNLGIRPLPNLETKFVAANTLIGVNRPGQQRLRNRSIDAKEAELRYVRQRHFLTRGTATKAKYREQDAKLRAEIAELLKSDGWDTTTAKKLAAWDPYDQNASADFFDPEWMYGLAEGFDLIIGNPPYISHDKLSDKIALRATFTTYEPFADIYCYFIEKSLRLLLRDGVLSFITSNSYIKADYGLPLRRFISQGTTILQLLNIEDSQVFESAIVNVAILLARRTKCNPASLALVTNAACDTVDFSDYVHASLFKIDNAAFGGPMWSLAPEEVLRIKRKIEKAGVTLERLHAKIRLGIATGANEAFIIDERQRSHFLKLDRRNGEIIKPILRGRDIDRYSYTHKGHYYYYVKY